MTFNDVDILIVKRNDYSIHFLCLSKDETINLLRNGDLTKKSTTLKT